MDLRTLLIACGNPGRCDDGVGPALAARLEAVALPQLTVESTYQLAIEDAERICSFDAVVFADASRCGPAPFAFQPLLPADLPLRWTSHVLAPAEVLALARDLFAATPAAFLLSLRGYVFDRFGECLSPRACRNLDRTVEFLRGLLPSPAFENLVRGTASATSLASRWGSGARGTLPRVPGKEPYERAQARRFVCR